MLSGSWGLTVGSTFSYGKLGAQPDSDSPLWLCQDILECTLF